MFKNKNFEIKSPVEDYFKTKSLVKKLSSRYTNKKFSTEIQKDIYFKVNSGRLKLRIINNNFGELIRYNRKESKKLRVSNYRIFKTKDYKNLFKMLSDLFEIMVIVNKKREICVIENIRIHLDKVKFLGEFLEFEIIYNDFGKSRKQMEFLIDYFSLDRKKFINNSYSDLLLNNIK